MISGIYRLEFPSGNYYLGKSVDIEKRWKQHRTALLKGTHTKILQAEYNVHGTYTQEVVFECHPDHLDIVEETFIARLRPPLNTSIPEDRLPGIDGTEFDAVLSYLDDSTVSHIKQISTCKDQMRGLQNMIGEMEEQIAELEGEIGELSKDRTEEEIAYDTLGVITRISKDNVALINKDLALEAQNKQLSSKVANLEAYKKLPWYKKIF